MPRKTLILTLAVVVALAAAGPEVKDLIKDLDELDHDVARLWKSRLEEDDEEIETGADLVDHLVEAGNQFAYSGDDEPGYEACCPENVDRAQDVQYIQDGASGDVTVDCHLKDIYDAAIGGNSFTGAVVVHRIPERFSSGIFMAPLQAGEGSKYPNIEYPLEEITVGKFGGTEGTVSHHGFDHTASTLPATDIEAAKAKGLTGRAGHDQICDFADPTGKQNCVAWTMVKGADTQCAFSFNSMSTNSGSFNAQPSEACLDAIAAGKPPMQVNAECCKAINTVTTEWAQVIVDAVLEALDGSCDTLVPNKNTILAEFSQMPAPAPGPPPPPPPPPPPSAAMAAASERVVDQMETGECPDV